MSDKPRILVLTGCYLPGFRGGGPLRTIFNAVNSLHGDFDFHILTADRDLGDAAPYPGMDGASRKVPVVVQWNATTDELMKLYEDSRNFKLDLSATVTATQADK